MFSPTSKDLLVSFIVVALFSLVMAQTTSAALPKFTISHPPNVITNVMFNLTISVVDDNGQLVSNYNGKMEMYHKSGSNYLINVNSEGKRVASLSTSSPFVFYVSNGKARLNMKGWNFYNGLQFEVRLVDNASWRSVTSSINIVSPPYWWILNVREGNFNSGQLTSFTLNLIGNPASKETMTFFEEIVQVTTDPVLNGFPIDVKPVGGVVTISNVFVSEPKQVELKVSYQGTRMVSFSTGVPQINVGNSANFNFTLTKMEIQPGETFSGSFSLYDSVGNFLSKASGSAYLSITYNGNQKMKVDASVSKGLCTFPLVSIEKIYSNLISVQAGYTSPNNQVFLSDSIQVQGYNLTIGQPEPSIIPQPSSSVPKPDNSSVIIKPNNSVKKPVVSNQVKPIATQRVNESKLNQTCYAMVICLTLLITLI